MRCLLVVMIVAVQLSIVLTSTTTAPDTCTADPSCQGEDSKTCKAGCTCGDGEEDSSTVTKQEGLAAAVGAMTPLVLGGAGLGLYKLFKGAGSSFGGMEGQASGMSSPSMKRGSIPSSKDSPMTYRSSRRGSTPVSMFGEDDEISFDESPRPGTTSTYTNVHRAFKGDSVNRWM